MVIYVDAVIKQELNLLYDGFAFMYEPIIVLRAL